MSEQKYFICPGDPSCIPCIEAEDLEKAKEKMCAMCVKASTDGLACKGPIEVVDKAMTKYLSRRATKTKAERRCRICGCTDNNACQGGCYWVEEDLCSACDEVADGIINTDAAKDVLDERLRQIKKYGFDAEHDNRNAWEELKWAAYSYLENSSIHWPWFDSSYKGEKDTYRQRLVTAAALILAEIERIDRLPEDKQGKNEDSR